MSSKNNSQISIAQILKVTLIMLVILFCGIRVEKKEQNIKIKFIKDILITSREIFKILTKSHEKTFHT